MILRFCLYSVGSEPLHSSVGTKKKKPTTVGLYVLEQLWKSSSEMKCRCDF